MTQPLDRLASLTANTWALSPTFLAGLFQLAQIEARGGTDLAFPEAHTWNARAWQPFTAGRGNGGGKGGGTVAVLPLHGMISQRGGWYGGTSTQQFGQWLAASLRDTSVSQILIDVDSHGGEIYGVQELAEAIFAARSVKPVVAVINGCAEGSGYWLASQAGKLYISPGSEAGGIGVSALHQDHSAALKGQGVNVTLISSGKYKTEGHPYGPLAPESKEFIQRRLDQSYATFTRDVARGRGLSVDLVRNGMGQGRVLGSFFAFAEKMVDGISPFRTVLRNMGGHPIGPDDLGGSALQTSGRAAASLRRLN